MALAARQLRQAGPAWILVVGIVGAALFLGDAVITPAISVLSAVEGIEVVTPAFEPYVVPFTLRDPGDPVCRSSASGRAGLPRCSAPSPRCGFSPSRVSGLMPYCGRSRDTCRDQSALYRRISLSHSPGTSFVTIGAVFLAVTGAEALYADLGHFGRKPIVLAWLWSCFLACCSTISGRAPSCSPATARRPPILRDEHGLDAGPDGGAGDGGDRDRQPGGHFGRVLAGPPGRAAQHAAALRGAAHV